MSTPVILFDGVCNYCNSTINFIIRQDKKRIFRFATLQSAFGQTILKQWSLSQTNFESILLLEEKMLYSKSQAVLRIYNKLPWFWKWTQAFRIIPKFLRDTLYDIIARNRYKWFGRKKECMMPTAELKDRFLS